MSRRLTGGRVVAGIAAAALLAVATYHVAAAVEVFREVHAARVAEPIHLEVDLSRPGEYVGDFLQTFDQSHGEWIYLQDERDSGPGFVERVRFEGLRGHLVITTMEGEPVLEREIHPGSFDSGLRMTPFPKGEYQLKLTVEQGAPAMASIPHALTASYQLCGMELFPAGVSGLTALGCLLVAGVLIGGVVWGTIKQARTDRQAAD
jgi:hypothetical protein